MKCHFPVRFSIFIFPLRVTIDDATERESEEIKGKRMAALYTCSHDIHIRSHSINMILIMYIISRWSAATTTTATATTTTTMTFNAYAMRSLFACI